MVIRCPVAGPSKITVSKRFAPSPSTSVVWNQALPSMAYSLSEGIARRK